MDKSLFNYYFLGFHIFFKPSYFLAIATGAVLYVVFFEIFPKAKQIGGTGFQHVTSMILGFLVFIPSIFVRK